MERNHAAEPAILIVFGAGGDLTWRKLIPAIFNLYLDHECPERFAVLGLDRQAMSDDEFRKHLRDGVDRFSRRGKTEDKAWQNFASHLYFQAADFSQQSSFTTLVANLQKISQDWGVEPNLPFYLAVPPDLIGLIAGQLSACGLA